MAIANIQPAYESIEKAGRRPAIFVLSCMVLFWTMFDSIIQYITPLVISEHGFSTTMVGLILGSSSIAGAIFDFFVCRCFTNTNFRRIFLAMFAICFVYPLILWGSKTIGAYLFAMVLWGIYFDLYGFGVFDFVSRYTKDTEHASSFGIVQIFRALGSMLAPLIVGFVIVAGVDWRAFTLGWFFLTVGLLFFIALLLYVRNTPAIAGPALACRRKNFLIEFKLWKKISKKIHPALLLTFFLFFIEAFFWTLAPLYGEHMGLKGFGGLFLASYTLPALLLGWFVGSLTKKFGKKRTAFFGLLIGSMILTPLALLSNPWSVIALTFFSSLFISIALPSINGAYADYISEAPQVGGEIESVEDFSFNIGYVLGPICAGLFADLFNISIAFSILGVMGVVVALILLKITPKQINIEMAQGDVL